jgi:hypothetical protein
MNRPAFAFRLTVALVLCGASALPAASQPPAVAPVQLVPHRAVYDLSLDTSTAGSNVTDIRGRLVFEFTGSTCQGYSLNTRLVTAIVDREGKAAMTDIRSKSWEQADGGRFRFHTSQYLNSQLSEDTKGDAKRTKDSRVQVTVQKPLKSQLSLAPGVMFPTQHSLAILDAASKGQHRLQANLFDGSEKGTKVYETTTFIGKPFPAGANKVLPPVENAASLDDLVSWPVVISYYGAAESKEGLPVYETSFRMYANGVSRKLRFDYGSFAMTGEIAEIEFKKPEPCAAPRGKAKNS